MEFQIHHTCCYSYSDAVFIEPQIFRFQPRVDGAQLLGDFQLQVNPTPACMSTGLDAEGNTVATAWFDGLHLQFAVSMQARVKTTRHNPFDFLISPAAAMLPINYAGRLRSVVAPALHRDEHDSEDSVSSFAEKLIAKCTRHTIPFLNALNQELHEGYTIIHREHGLPIPPAEMLRRKEGACRDVAVLFIDVCRAAGLAARFVSGYQESSEEHQPELHAWAEVYIPDAGWRGFDPTQGLAVADGHVAVAASIEPMRTAPVSGSFRGKAQSQMQNQIQVQVLADRA